MDTKLIKRKNEDSNGLTLAISNNDNNNDNSSNINSNQLTSTTATHATKTTNTTITNNKNKSESVPYTTMASLSKLNVTKSSQKTSTTAHNSTNQQSPITASAGSAKIADIDLNHVSIRVSDIKSYEQQICEPESDSELTSALSKSPLTQITNNSAPNTNLNNGNEQGKMENPLNAAHANENNENVLKQSNSRVSKTRGSKNIFKTIFCCFSNVNRKRPNQNKNNISNSASNINSNTNKQTITTMVSKNELHDSKSIRINNEYNNQSNSNFKQAENSAVNGHQNNPLTNIQMNYANEQRGSENQKPDEKSLVDDAEHELIDEHEHDADHQHLNYRNSQANDNNSVSDRNSYLNQNDNLYNNHTLFYDDDLLINYQDKNLLPPIRTSDMGKKCLIIDLDETLVHSSFKQVHNADFVVPVEIDGIIHQVYVLKRPHVDEFLKRMGELFECVLFTASLAKYADPVADLLDKWGVFRARLFREACVYYRGNYVKDLSRLGRDLNKVIILDNSPISYIFHPDNAVACTSWFEDPRDNELIHLIPHFENLAKVDSVYSILKNSNQPQQHHQHFSLLQTMNNLPSALFRHSHHNKQQQQNLIKQHQDDMHYDESTHNQQVPSPTYAATTAYNQQQSIIYQQQQQQQQHILNNNNINNYSGEIDANNTSSVYNRNNPNMNKYVLNENKILLSIDMMTANKAQQHNPITQLSNPY